MFIVCTAFLKYGGGKKTLKLPKFVWGLIIPHIDVYVTSALI